MIEHVCQCCGRTEALPEGARESPKWGGVWSFPPVHEVTCCPRCPTSHLILGQPCDHEWTEDRYDAANRAMAEDPAFQETARLIEEAMAKGWTTEELLGLVQRMVIRRGPKQ